MTVELSSDPLMLSNLLESLILVQITGFYILSLSSHPVTFLPEVVDLGSWIKDKTIRILIKMNNFSKICLISQKILSYLVFTHQNILQNKQNYMTKYIVIVHKEYKHSPTLLGIIWIIMLSSQFLSMSRQASFLN